MRIHLSLISAFSTVAQGVSMMTHFSLYICHIWTFGDLTHKALFCVRKQNQTGNEEINSETCVSFGAKTMALSVACVV